MSATTTALPNSRSTVNNLESSFYYTLAANTTIPAGTLAMRVSGQDYVQPYVGNTANAILMGVAEETYINTSGSPLVFSNDKPMVFRRGCFQQFKSDGTITAAADVMCLVGLKDNQTIGHTVASHDCTALLVNIDLRSTPTVYDILITSSGPT